MAYELDREEIPRFGKHAMAALERHSWPGNVRELKNVVERAVYRSDTPRITEIIFDPFHISKPGEHPEAAKEPAPERASPREERLMKMPFKRAVHELEIILLKRALEGARYHQRDAAESLGLSYHQFRGLYRKYAKDLA